ncbi:MAG: hypothetical protein A2451_03790 [Bdellovibrionales bacterium RIFOXYC2_FULL_39_8]|nr:MAG: hypothetical protein A2451_03790 [Bdellovibrionales bacterium RIFOXYC2_FULL_39_8]
MSKTIANISYSRQTIADKLNEIPELKEMVLTIMESPDIPQSIKRVIKDSLERRSVPVRVLDATARAKMGMPDYIKYSYINNRQKIGQYYVTSTEEGITAPLKEIISVLNGPLSNDGSELIKLVHELAHARFDAFFNKNIAKFAKRFPPPLIKQLPDGRYLYHEDLYSYLTERYAFEKSYQLQRSAYPQYFSKWSEEIGPGPTETPENIRKYLNDAIVDVYKIRFQPLLDLLAKNPSRSLKDLLSSFNLYAENPLEEVGQKFFVERPHEAGNVPDQLDSLSKVVGGNEETLHISQQVMMPMKNNKLSQIPLEGGDMLYITTKFERDNVVHSGAGIVDGFILNNDGKVTGIRFAPVTEFEPRKRIENLPSRIIQIEDINFDKSYISEKKFDLSNQRPLALQDNLPIPDNSGKYMFSVSRSSFQAPVSVGDNIDVKLLKPMEIQMTKYTSESKTNLIGKVTSILKDKNGEPIGIIIAGDDFHMPKDREYPILFENISRKDYGAMIRLDERGLAVPGSNVRRPYNGSVAWFADSPSRDFIFHETSGSWTVQVKSVGGPDLQAPVTLGDEIRIAFKYTDGKYEKAARSIVLIKDWVKNNKGEIIGFDVEHLVNHSYGPNNSNVIPDRILFSQLSRDDSFIYGSGGNISERANKIPGAMRDATPYRAAGDSINESWRDRMNEWAKKGRANQGGGDIVRPVSEYSPWTNFPANYEDWAHQNGVMIGDNSSVVWAQWVLGVNQETSAKEVKVAYRKLAKRFHPDGKGKVPRKKEESEAMTVINRAYEI